MEIPNTQVKSPCIKECRLNDEDVCVGCFRTVSEIGMWGSMDKAAQLSVIANIKERLLKKTTTS